MSRKSYSTELLGAIMALFASVNMAGAFSGAGSGTESDPYIITNVNQLQEMSDDLDAWYELGNNIDASDTRNWNDGAGFILIGSGPSFSPGGYFSGDPFGGNFDGSGHIITGLYINRPDTDFVGLFGYAHYCCEIKDVGLINLDITGRHYVGGLIGLIDYNGSCTRCYTTGRVCGADISVGGLIGDNYMSDVTDCYSTAIVSGVGAVGGLIGRSGAHYYGDANISRCYSVGLVNDGVPDYCFGGLCVVGGLVGWAPLTRWDSCYWDVETSGQTISACGIGKTTAQMKQKASFTNWDFDTVWDIIEDETYPFLRGVGGEIPPEPPSALWVKVANTPQGVWTLRKEAGLQAEVLMVVPNDWVLKRVGESSQTADGYIWWNVESVAEGINGWIAEKKIGGVSHLVEVSDEPWATQEFQPSQDPAEQSETVPIILEAVDHYYNNTDSVSSLYSSDDSQNDLSVFQRAGFPLDLILAIAATESAGTEGGKEKGGGGLVYAAFNNALVTWDGGYGIMQLTSPEYKGMASGLQMGASAEECLAYRWVWVGYKSDFFQEYLCNWYSNTRQGIYANIKDGLRALREKYLSDWSGPDRVIEGLTFTSRDLRNINAVWGYNGYVYSGRYLADVADRLENIASYFPGESYDNADNLIEKLRIANDNRRKAKLYSPGELCVTTPRGETTGILDRQMYVDIVCSAYDSAEEAVTLLLPEEPLSYRVSGTSNGIYGLTVDAICDGIPMTFAAVGIPMSPGVKHVYTVDWQALSAGEEGVTLEIDSDSDGVPERTVIADEDLTAPEFALQTETVIDFEPDVLNLQSKAKVVTVYIELPEGFDVSNIDPSSIKLNDAVPALSKPVQIGDYDIDGVPDLMVKFDCAQVAGVLEPGRRVVAITGQLADETLFAGMDTIRVIGSGGAEATASQTDLAVPQEQVPMPAAKENLPSVSDSGDTGTREAFDPQEAVAFMLFEARDLMDQLGPQDLANEDAAFKLACAIDAVFVMCQDGLYAEAMAVLEGDILQRIDGCANTGEPDEDDWIRSIEGQILVYPLVMETIELLESII